MEVLVATRGHASPDVLTSNLSLVRYGFWSQTIKAVMGYAEAAMSAQDSPEACKKCFAYLMQRIAALYESAPRVISLEDWAEASLVVELLIQPLWLLLDISTDHDVTSPEARARFKAWSKSSRPSGRCTFVGETVRDEARFVELDKPTGYVTRW